MDHLGPEEGEASKQQWSRSVEVLLVRHAESRNNALRREVVKELGGAEAADALAVQKEVDRRRREDAELSERGDAQAQALASCLSSRLGGYGAGEVLLVCSPMRRAIRTMEPTAKALAHLLVGKSSSSSKEEDQDRWLCMGRYYEVGGCYLGGSVYPGSSPAQIQDSFPGLKCVEFPSGGGGWYSGRESKETQAEAAQRAEDVVCWLLDLLASAATARAAEDGGGGGGSSIKVVVLVGHGEFMHLCLNRLLGAAGNSSSCSGQQRSRGYVHGNTGISTLHYRTTTNRGGGGQQQQQQQVLVESLNGMGHLEQALRTGMSIEEDGWWEVVGGGASHATSTSTSPTAAAAAVHSQEAT